LTKEKNLRHAAELETAAAFRHRRAPVLSRRRPAARTHTGGCEPIPVGREGEVVLDTWQRRVAVCRCVVVLSVCCGRARSAGEACRRKTADAPGRRKSDSGSAPPPAALSRPLATAGAARCCDDGTSGSTRSGRARQRTSKRHSAARPRRARVHTESARNSRDEKRRDEKRAAVSAERCDSFLWRLSEEEDQSLVRALAERAPRRLGGALLPRCGAHVHRRCHHSIAAIGAQ
jgi:hypothetical protein